MFTGLVETVGRVSAVERAGQGRKLRIESDLPSDELVLGESVAVDGACLTVTAFGERWFDVDASYETVARTTLADVRVGARVHLERALRLGDRLGGHLVTGHVDGRGALTERKPVGEAWALRFRAPAELAAQIVEKGSIAIDGVSLTVNGCGPGWFSVTIVPFTSGETKLLEMPVGAPVNLETDLLGKYVVHVLSQRGEGGKSSQALGDALRRAGFM